VLLHLFFPPSNMTDRQNSLRTFFTTSTCTPKQLAGLTGLDFSEVATAVVRGDAAICSPFWWSFWSKLKPKSPSKYLVAMKAATVFVYE